MAEEDKDASSDAPSEKDNDETETLPEVETTLTRTVAFRGILPVVYHMVIGTFSRAVALFVLAVAAVSIGLAFLFPGSAVVIGLVGLIVACLPLAAVLLLAIVLSGSFVRHRQAAFPSAREALLDRIRRNRAERREKYDLYLPVADEHGTVDAPVGLILYPGALVEHTAYAIIASALSDEGIVVAVANLEPLRFGTFLSGASKEDALHIMYDVLSGGGSVNVTEWALGGHSAGASAAFNLARELRPGVSKLVQWGIMSAMELKGTLREGSAVNALVVNASNDGIVHLGGPKVEKIFRSYLPPTEQEADADDTDGCKGRATYFTIEGGNHVGFSHYGPQVYPKRDGDRTITLEEQQRICVEATSNFLLGRQDGANRPTIAANVCTPLLS